MKDYYAILDVEVSASQETIRTAYRKLSKILHPDLNRGVELPLYKAVNEAYQTLGDPTRRAAYDALQRVAQHSPAHTASPATASESADDAEREEWGQETSWADAGSGATPATDPGAASERVDLRDGLRAGVHGKVVEDKQAWRDAFRPVLKQPIGGVRFVVASLLTVAVLALVTVLAWSFTLGSTGGEGLVIVALLPLLVFGHALGTDTRSKVARNAFMGFIYGGALLMALLAGASLMQLQNGESMGLLYWLIWGGALMGLPLLAARTWRGFFAVEVGAKPYTRGSTVTTRKA